MSGIQLMMVGRSGASLSEYWIDRYSTTKANDNYDLAVDSSGNLYTTGYYKTSVSGSDTSIIKYNTSGEILWQRRLGDNLNGNFGNGISVDSSGNVYCGLRAGGFPVYAKYNSSGSIQWQKSYGTTFNGSILAIKHKSGSVYVAGWYGGFSGSGVGGIISKIDESTGALTFTRSLVTSPEYVYLNGIDVDGSGNIYVCGYTLNPSTNAYRGIIAKYNSSGTLQWQREISSGTKPVTIEDISIGSDGNIYIVGYVEYQFDSSVYLGLLLGYDSSGNIALNRQLGNAASNNYVFYNSVSAESGEIYIGGSTNTGDSSYRALIVKYATPANGGTLLFRRAITVASVYDSVNAIVAPGYPKMYGAGAGGATDSGLLFELESEGNLTGTYSPYTYASVTIGTSTSNSIASNASSLTSASQTPSSNTTSYTDVALDLTVIRTEVI